MANTEVHHTVPRPPGVTVMLLFDNSRFTEIAWSDLRDHYLRSLFDKLISFHPSASITIFIQECYPQNRNMNELSPRTPRKYYILQDVTQLQDLHFSDISTNRLTPLLIHEAIEFLSAKDAVARHIVIIGSSPLQNEYSNIDWPRLAQSLAMGNIYCHLMLHAHAAGPTEPLNLLFYETLRLQRLAEDKSWFSDDNSQIVPRLSSVRALTPEVTPLTVTSNPRQSLSPILDPSAHNISKGSGHSMQATNAHISALDEELPSIVTQLQQMHGLTKKKVYGTKPKRRPFVSSEVYRETPRKAASLSPVSPSDTNHGGRVASASLIDRASRIHHNGSVLSQPSIARSSSLEVVTSVPTPVFNTAPSYVPPTVTMSVPSSPVSSRPPLYSDSTMLSSRTTYSQPQPLPMQSSSLTFSKSTNHANEDKTVKAYSRVDGGVTNSLPRPDDRLYLKNRDQDTSINMTTSYTISHSVYREELLSQSGGPSVGSTSSNQHFTHAPRSDSTSYVPNNQNIALRQSNQWHTPYNSPHNYPSDQSNTISQYNITVDQSEGSPYPSSPVTSNSSSLLGWAG